VSCVAASWRFYGLRLRGGMPLGSVVAGLFIARFGAPWVLGSFCLVLATIALALSDAGWPRVPALTGRPIDRGAARGISSSPLLPCRAPGIEGRRRSPGARAPTWPARPAAGCCASSAARARSCARADSRVNPTERSVRSLGRISAPLPRRGGLGNLVAEAGLEPAWVSPTRPSNVRVCQFPPLPGTWRARRSGFLGRGHGGVNAPALGARSENALDEQRPDCPFASALHLGEAAALGSGTNLP